MKLNALRRRIDTVDRKIMDLVATRITLAKEVGRLKREQNLTVIDTKREDTILSAVRNSAKKLGIPETLAMKIIHLLISYSKKVQKRRI